MRALSALTALAFVVAQPRHVATRETVDVGVEDAAAPWSQPEGKG